MALGKRVLSDFIDLMASLDPEEREEVNAQIANAAAKRQRCASAAGTSGSTTAVVVPSLSSATVPVAG